MKLFIEFILIGGIIINFLIIFLLIKSRKKELSKKLLLLFFGVLIFSLINSYASINSLKVLSFITYLFNDLVEIIIGPILLLYIKSLFEDSKKIVSKDWIHFIPPVFYLIFISIPFLISFIREDFLFEYIDYLFNNSILYFLFCMGYLILYILMSIKLFRKYRKSMKLNYSTLSENDFGWVKKMLIGLLIVAVIDFVILFGDLLNISGFNNSPVSLILIIILIVYLGYYGINQSKILLPDFLLKEEEHANNTYLPKNTSTINFSKNEILMLQTKLKSALEVDKLYLDEDLTLNKLATYINTTDKKLSTYLNQHQRITFYDIVNKERVESVKEKLQSNNFDNYTLLGIAYESGFKSKTSFNRIFKKETGLSPSDYRKQFK